MLEERMILVATSEGVNIHCSSNGKFSFFNSPYPSHRTFTGIDIYPQINFGDVAPSPVSGRVEKIRRVKCPEGKGFKSSKVDYLLILRSLENPKRVIKILHVDPIVKYGETIHVGQELGVLIRSGYFDFWTDPHIHVEVRRPSDALRARGGFRLESAMKLEMKDMKPVKELRGTVVESKPEYSLISIETELKYGIPVNLGDRLGILDGGIPHYGWFGVHVDKKPNLEEAVRLCGLSIGVIENVYSDTCLVKCDRIRFKCEETYVGLSLYLYPSSKPVVKIVPPELKGLKLADYEKTQILIA